MQSQRINKRLTSQFLAKEMVLISTYETGIWNSKMADTKTGSTSIFPWRRASIGGHSTAGSGKSQPHPGDDAHDHDSLHEVQPVPGSTKSCWQEWRRNERHHPSSRAARIAVLLVVEVIWKVNGDPQLWPRPPCSQHGWRIKLKIGSNN